MGLAAPGMARVHQLIQLGEPTPHEVASILEAHPTEQAAIAQLLQSTYGNHFTANAFRATAPTDALAEPVATPPAAVDPVGPLGPATDVDPAQTAADQIARGADDENQITNEVFWQQHPSLRGIKLAARTPAAEEWLRLRDLHVRPALARKTTPSPVEAKPITPAVAEVPVAAPIDLAELTPPTLEGGKAGPELGKVIADHVEAQPGVKAQPAPEAQPKGPAPEPTPEPQVTAQPGQSAQNAQNAKTVATDPAVAALLAWEPQGVTGEKGQAAWLLAAIDTKLIGAFAQTKAQLTRLAEGHDTVMSQEDNPDKVRSPAKNVKKVKNAKNGQGIYSIEMGDTPILGVLVTLATSRIQQWIDEGSDKVKMLFQLGTMARGDLGFGFHSKHAQGSAIDINFGEEGNKKAFSNEEDVIELLDGLEPGKIASVFPDNDNHIHLAVTNGKYDIGLPFQGPFFPYEKSLAAAKKAAEKKHPNPQVGDTITATGMDVYTSALNNKATAKYGEWKGKTKWWWGPTDKGSGGGARSKLKSQNLKDLLDKLEAGGDGPVPTAQAQDGHTENTEEPQPTATRGVDAAPAKEAPDTHETHETSDKLDQHDPEKCKADCGHDH